MICVRPMAVGTAAGVASLGHGTRSATIARPLWPPGVGHRLGPAPEHGPLHPADPRRLPLAGHGRRPGPLRRHRLCHLRCGEYPLQFKSDTVYDLLEDESGSLWISTAAGLLRYRGGVFAAYTAAQGLPADTVWFSHEDRRHRLWAMTAAGPAWFDGKSFSALWRGAQGVAPLNRRALAEDSRLDNSGWGEAAASLHRSISTRRPRNWRSRTRSAAARSKRWRSTARRISGSVPPRGWSGMQRILLPSLCAPSSR